MQISHELANILAANSLFTLAALICYLVAMTWKANHDDLVARCQNLRVRALLVGQACFATFGLTVTIRSREVWELIGAFMHLNTLTVFAGIVYAVTTVLTYISPVLTALIWRYIRRTPLCESCIPKGDSVTAGNE